MHSRKGTNSMESELLAVQDVVADLLTASVLKHAQSSQVALCGDRLVFVPGLKSFDSTLPASI